jgi:solute carrier family 35, member F1/2
VWPPKLASPLQNYLLLAAVDVEANYLIVRAYQYTNITSVTLLDSARYGRDAH